jgi:hypothetical protein
MTPGKAGGLFLLAPLKGAVEERPEGRLDSCCSHTCCLGHPILMQELLPSFRRKPIGVNLRRRSSSVRHSGEGRNPVFSRSSGPRPSPGWRRVLVRFSLSDALGTRSLSQYWRYCSPRSNPWESPRQSRGLTIDLVSAVAAVPERFPGSFCCRASMKWNVRSPSLAAAVIFKWQNGGMALQSALRRRATRPYEGPSCSDESNPLPSKRSHIAHSSVLPRAGRKDERTIAPPALSAPPFMVARMSGPAITDPLGRVFARSFSCGMAIGVTRCMVRGCGRPCAHPGPAQHAVGTNGPFRKGPGPRLLPRETSVFRPS